MSAKYNGWTNYETWNVALWIGNDYGLYSAARDFMLRYEGETPYIDFIKNIGFDETRNADDVAYMSPELDYEELDDFMNELNGD